MNRNMKKAITDYYKMIDQENTNKYAFYVSDMSQLMDMSRNKVDAVFNSLMAGFMVGYRAGMKDQKEGRR